MIRQKFIPNALSQVWITAALLTMGIGLLMVLTGESLTHNDAPLGIISFQFSWDALGASRVLAGWGPSQIDAALFSTRMDFAFLLSYGTALAAGALVFGGRFSAIAAWAAGGAAVLDALENIILLRLLSEGSTSGGVFWMSSAAAGKFLLVFATTLYVVWSVGIRVRK